MRNDIVGLAQQYAQEKAQTAVKRVAIPAAFGLVAVVFFLIVVIALFAALFYWLTSLYGPITAALLVAAVALVLGLIALLPLAVRRRPAPPPPPPNPPQFASLLAQTAPALALKRPLLSAFLLAVALGMMARGSSSTGKKAPAGGIDGLAGRGDILRAAFAPANAQTPLRYAIP